MRTLPNKLETALESATNLISANRLDVFTKTPLVYAWANDLDDAWGRELYATYMLATRPPGGFSENNSKFSLVDYIQSFRTLFESIQENGFDAKVGAIPVGEKGITNGAHRLAAALVLGEKVVGDSSTEADHNYGFKFFQSVRIPEVFVDATVTEYLNYANRTTVFCAMGITTGLAGKIQKELDQAGFDTIYVKAIKLSEIGQRRLMKVLYGLNDWWTAELYESLSMERFNNQDSSYFFFVKSQTTEREIHFKSQIRNQHFDNFSFKKFHSTDNKEETIRVADCILNKNSFLVLNEAPIGSEERLITEISNHPYLSTLNPRNFAVDGSANLEIIGLRKARDIDFIEIEKNLSEVMPHSSSHNSEYRSLPISPTKLITDPRNYAVIDGYRFVSIPQTIAFKAHRGEGKDLLDISGLCGRSVSTHVYGDRNDRKIIIFLRFRLLMRRRVNRAIAPLPDGVQAIIRRIYVRVRDFF